MRGRIVCEQQELVRNSHAPMFVSCEASVPSTNGELLDTAVGCFCIADCDLPESRRRVAERYRKTGACPASCGGESCA